ncbi:MarR family transcriptional regulator [Microlunatus endophyticus]|jgi:DNA-binding MarR family transcriptional regulator|uniref:MarR family transcriptional regulator n=1 Tax=Microlunatus endophyticus TaxID=1716077 RepID=A0A917SI03_9ACTN|nr:MarR family transcriptional regulator [Microlunatus endophyticus]GGL82100.1 MarR family transcriptional regulator [Microlunatus endophyticus]
MVERSNTSAGSDGQERIAHQARRLQQLLRRTGDAALQASGLTLAQHTVMRVIADSPDASSAEIARQCNVSRQSLQDLIRILRDHGLVRVAEQPVSGRSLPIRITPEGRRVLRKADRAISRVEDRMVAGIPARDVERVAALLDRCAENLEAL